ncbi:hypothetical protein BH11BAC2_BH11BAC2_15070 [soil metagenome]
MNASRFSVILGFLILFLVYHFPEFFDTFWVSAVFKILFLIIALLIGRVQGFNGLSGYALRLRESWGTNLLKGLSIGILFFSISIYLSNLLGYTKIYSIENFKIILLRLPFLLLVTGIPSLAEDMLTRGYLFTHYRKKLSSKNWIIFSAVIYTLNHIWRLQDGIAVSSYLLLFGAVLALIVVRTQSLWLAFGIHWGANLTYECSKSVMVIDDFSQYDESTWLLALTWLILLIILIVTKKSSRKTYFSKTN